MALLPTVCDDVVSRLAAGAYSQSVVVERKEIPIHEAADVVVAHASVHPISILRSSGTRQKRQIDFVIGILVQVKTTSTDQAAIDAAFTLVEELVARLEGWAPPSCIGTLPVQIDPPIVREQLHQYGVFVSGIQATYRLLE